MSLQGIEALTEGCKGLKWLNLTGCSWVNDACCIAIADGIPQLRGLYVSRCYLVSDAGVIAVAARRGATMTHLALAGCHQVGDLAMQALASSCHALVALVLSGTQVSVQAVERVTWSCPGLVASVKTCRFVTLCSGGSRIVADQSCSEAEQSWS